MEHVGHTFFCRADDIFLSSSWDSWKKCQAVEIQTDGFWAVDPDSSDSFESSFQNILRKQKYLTTFKIKIYLKIKNGNGTGV